MEPFELSLIFVTIALFGASMYQAHLMRSEKKLSQKPFLSSSLDWSRNKISLKITNIGNGLAKDIDLVISSSGTSSLHSKLDVRFHGLAKDRSYVINDWQKDNFVGISSGAFDYTVTGTCRDIFNDSHKINVTGHYE